MSITGTEQPTKVGVPIADLIAGMNGAFGVVAALHERAHAPAAAASSAPRCWPAWSACTRSRAPAGLSAGEVPGLAGDHHPSIAPYGMFATATAPVQIAVRLGGAVAARSRAAFGWTPPRRGSPPTASASPTATS